MKLDRPLPPEVVEAMRRTVDQLDHPVLVIEELLAAHDAAVAAAEDKTELRRWAEAAALDLASSAQREELRELTPRYDTAVAADAAHGASMAELATVAELNEMRARLERVVAYVWNAQRHTDHKEVLRLARGEGEDQ